MFLNEQLSRQISPLIDKIYKLPNSFKTSWYIYIWLSNELSLVLQIKVSILLALPEKLAQQIRRLHYIQWNFRVLSATLPIVSGDLRVILEHRAKNESWLQSAMTKNNKDNLFPLLKEHGIHCCSWNSTIERWQVKC